MLSKEDGAELIKLAKEAVQSYYRDETPKVPDKIKKKFGDKKGVFVSLKKGNQLRGCIGYTEPTLVLWEAVANAARGAAFGDPRFPPTSEEEAKEITFEISVLTEPELIEKKGKEIEKKIEIGRHGLIVEKEQYKGILLPQVFTEFGVDEESALQMTCEKAGLPANAWTKPETKVYRFECQIFKE